MPAIILQPLLHRHQESIAIHFKNNSELNGIIKKLPGAKWSQSHKCWNMPLSKEHYNQLFVALKGKAQIEQAAFHAYLSNKKRNNE